MLDLEMVEAPTEDGLSIVTREEMKRHLRITHSKSDLDIDDLIRTAAATLHGQEGQLNRTVFPMTWVRYLPGWPCNGIIRLPYPPVVEVLGITYGGGSPPDEIAVADCVVRTRNMVPEIVLPSGARPRLTAHPRAVAVTYRAGYTQYPLQLKRAVKILVSHFFENPDATINEPRQTAMNRKVEFGFDWLKRDLKVPNSYDDWD